MKLTWVAPSDIAWRILSHVFPDELERDGESTDRTLSGFQQRALLRCVEILDRRGGVILADAVGLGKTYVGLALARRFVRSGLDVAAVVPSPLRHQWERLLRRIDPHAVVLTHAGLSRGGYPPALVRRPGLLLVDEAHAFRNPAARRYGALARLAANRRVCLITATPVNNSLWDLYHLVRLFAGERSFDDVGVADLRLLFKDLAAGTGGEQGLRAVTRAVVVRRSRSDLAVDPVDDRAGLRFPVLQPPVTVPYDVNVVAHAAVLAAIARLRMDAFGPEPAALLRYLLLKRLASSGAALLSTTHSLIQLQHERLAALREGLLLAPGDLRILRRSSDLDQLSLRRLLLRPLPLHMDAAAVERAVRADLDILHTIKRRTAECSDTDDKLDQLRRLAFDVNSTEKLLVFTEFRDTAAYLWRALAGRGGVALIHGSGAWLGTGRASRAAVIARFAPNANGGRRVPPRERVRVLIATDVLAEGLNLQDCAHVISYDLPWNPVRLIQRIGRIDRMGSLHDEVFAYNFVPDRQVEAYLALLGRLRIKLRAIDLAVGLEHPVIAGDGDRTGFEHLRTLNQVPRVAARVGGSDEALRAWLRRAASNRDADRDRSCVLATAMLLPGVAPATYLVLCDGGRVYGFRRQGVQMEVIDPAEVADVCTRWGSLPAPNADRLAEVRKMMRQAGRLMSRSQLPGADGVFKRDPAVRLARRIQMALAGMPGGAGDDRAAQAERLIAALVKGPSAGEAASIAKLGSLEEESFDGLVSLVSDVLGDARPRAESGMTGPQRGGGGEPDPVLLTVVFVNPRG